MGNSRYDKPNKRKEIEENKAKFLVKLKEMGGLIALTGKELDFGLRTTLTWRQEDKVFSDKCEEIIVEAEKLHKENIVKQLRGIADGSIAIHPAACSVLIFSAKALVGWSDQPEKKADVVNVLLPDWVLDKIKGKGDKPGKE